MVMTRRGFLLGATALACAGGADAAVIQPPYNPLTPITLSMPSGLGWDTTNFPITVQLYDPPGLARATGAVSVTPEGLFNGVSTALSAPGATYYVNVSTGADTNNGTSSGTAFKSISAAISAANTAAVPAKINVAAGTYIRAYGPAGTVPTHDIAFVATGGRVNVGTFDTFTAAADTTYTNCYSFTSITSNVDRICDCANLNQYGNYTTLFPAPSAAACNVTPNSWYLVSGTKVLINRMDGLAPTLANTHVLRAAVNFFYFTSQVNVYMGDGLATPNFFPFSGFDLEGGSSSLQGCFAYNLTSQTSTLNVITAKNCSFKYAGGGVSTASNGVSMQSHSGLAAFFSCTAGDNAADCFNHHVSFGSPESLMLTVNCTGYNTGLTPDTSNNGWTSHDTCIGIDVAGHYVGNHGGTVRSINSAKAWLCGTFSQDDRGDVALGGVIQPDAFSVNNTATYWCDRTKASLPSGNGSSYAAEVSGSTINLRNVWPSPASRGGPGTISTY